MVANSEPAAGEPALPHELSSRLEDLVERWQQGDRSAGNLLFGKYYPELVTFARRLLPRQLRRRAETRDIVQDACLSACASRSSLENRDTSSFVRWLFAIVENRLWKRWRRERAQLRDVVRTQGLDDAMAVDAAAVTPSENLSLRERMSHLRDGLHQLSGPHQRVITARYLDGKSWNEIAAEFGKSKAAVQMLLTRALKRLREELGESGSP